MLKNLAKYTLLLACFCGLPLSGVLAQCGVSPNFSEGPQTSPPNLSCANSCDGQILSIPSGGSSPYTYLWSTTPPQTIAAATGLCAGVYTVTITDFIGCVSVFTDSIVAPSPVTAVFTDIPGCNSQCSGAAIVYVGGGCSGLGLCPYDYVFTNLTTTTSTSGQLDSILAFPNLCPGDYSISVVDQIPCPAVTATVTVTEASILQPSITSPNGSFTTSCSGVCDAQLDGVAIGSIPPYTYSWDDPAAQTTASASGLCGSPSPGIAYTFTVIDSIGCTDTETANIVEPDPLITTTSQVALLCGVPCSGSASVIPSGGTVPYTYAWDDPAAQTGSTATGMCQGSYNVIITDNNGCQVTEPFIFTTPPGLLGDVVPFSDCDAAGNLTLTATATPTSGTAPFTYSWDDIAAQTTQTAVGLTIGQTYNVVVLDALGCRLDASTTIPTALCELIIPNTFSPNDDDFNDTWFIESLNLYEQSEVKVYNRWGDIVFKSTGYDTPWDGKYANSDVPAAVYYYVIEVPEIEKNYNGSVTIVR